MGAPVPESAKSRLKWDKWLYCNGTWTLTIDGRRSAQVDTLNNKPDNPVFRILVFEPEIKLSTGGYVGGSIQDAAQDLYKPIYNPYFDSPVYYQRIMGNVTIELIDEISINSSKKATLWEVSIIPTGWGLSGGMVETEPHC